MKKVKAEVVPAAHVAPGDVLHLEYPRVSPKVVKHVEWARGRVRRDGRKRLRIVLVDSNAFTILPEQGVRREPRDPVAVGG